MTEIGQHSAAAFADLARTGRLQLNARDLPRDLVTDNTDPATARLDAAWVSAPAPVTDAVLRAYDVVGSHPTHIALAPTRRGPGGIHVDLGIDSLSRPVPYR